MTHLRIYLSPYLKSMSVCSKLLLSFLLILFISADASAQKQKDLENKKKTLQKEIQVTENLLNETKQNKKLSLNQLVTLNRKISMREELIRTINSEIRLLDRQINESRKNIEALKAEIQKLKEEYSKMIYFAGRNRSSYDRLMFLFSSRDFNQAYKRLKYMQQYNEYRRKQAELIVQTQEQIDIKIAELEKVKISKQRLLNSEEQEKQLLAREKGEQESTLTRLQEKEKELMAALKEKEKEQKQLQAAIQKIIEEELRLAREAAKKAGKGSSAGKTLTLTPEAMKLSATFESNKASLPWPVTEGLITGKFGEHQHPVLKGIVVKNNGVDISTSRGATVRAIFSGEVTGVAVVPNASKVVIIRHGEYLSVYSNLEEVTVKMGDKISTKQVIGTVSTDEGNSRSEVHLEIYKGQNALNPELWLFKN
jgi:murein hydrolase activator